MRFLYSPKNLVISCIVFLTIQIATWSVAEGPQLTVIMVGDGDKSLTPKVYVPGDDTCCQLKQDIDGRRWTLPLRVDPHKLITPYVVAVDAPDAKIVAIRVEFPSSLESQNQTLTLQPAKIEEVTEKIVRDYWNDNRIFVRPLDVSSQLMALQDLHFIVSDQNKKSPTATPSAARVRAAYLLLVVVQNLGWQTWYIVDDHYQGAVDYAVRILEKATDEQKCRWLGTGSCATVPNLLKGIRELNGSRLGRIYSLIVPPNAKITSSFCDDERIGNLRNYYVYFTSTIDNASAGAMRAGSGVSETRIASEFAACVVARLTCGEVPSETANALLKEAADRLVESRRLYRDEKAMSDVDNRIVEVKHLRDAIAQHQSIACLK